MKKFLYYLIQWTWGLPMSLLGLISFGVCKLFGCRHYRYRKAICIVLPNGLSGFNLGMFIFHGKWAGNVCEHEYGHSIQNLMWGPLFLFVIWIPSVCRYWYRQIYMNFIYKRNRKKLPDYLSIWFEKQSTKLGMQANANNWSWL